MTKLPNIAFVGRAGSGKTTARQYLEEAYDYELFSWAAPIKAGCGTNDDRALLQRVGQGVRDLYEDFWVNLGLVDLDISFGERFANDDTRYPNEAAALRGRGFVVVRVAASYDVRRERLRLNGRLQDEAQLEHHSETALDAFRTDYTLVNDSSDPENLHGRLDEIVNRERS